MIGIVPYTTRVVFIEGLVISGPPCTLLSVRVAASFRSDERPAAMSGRADFAEVGAPAIGPGLQGTGPAGGLPSVEMANSEPR